MNIPTAHSTESLERFLNRIREIPVPALVSRAYLIEEGFKSGNDPELRHIVRLLGFLNDDDKPTDRWQKYKETGEEVLRQAVLECYEELFKLFPDAPTRTNDELSIWFQYPITGEARSAQERATRTFKKLCLFAGIVRANDTNTEFSVPAVKSTALRIGSSSKSREVILLLPMFEDKADYVRLFEALKDVFYEDEL